MVLPPPISSTVALEETVDEKSKSSKKTITEQGNTRSLGDATVASGEQDGVAASSSSAIAAAVAAVVGIGAGITAAVATSTDKLPRSEAIDTPFQNEESVANVTPTLTLDTKTTEDATGRPRAPSDAVIDPEIVERAIRPAIDPHFGDLLPLPPSEPSSPIVSELDLDDYSFPELPLSRPETPPEHERDHYIREQQMAVQRRRLSETPIKTPTSSPTAVPISFLLQRSGSPSTVAGSPMIFKPPPPSSPQQSPTEGIDVGSGSDGQSGSGSASGTAGASGSPVTTPGGQGRSAHELFSTPRRRPPRPQSWDSSRDLKPLMLVMHHHRTGSQLSDVDSSSSPSSQSGFGYGHSRGHRHNNSLGNNSQSAISTPIRRGFAIGGMAGIGLGSSGVGLGNAFAPGGEASPLREALARASFANNSNRNSMPSANALARELDNYAASQSGNASEAVADPTDDVEDYDADSYHAHHGYDGYNPASMVRSEGYTAISSRRRMRMRTAESALRPRRASVEILEPVLAEVAEEERSGSDDPSSEEPAFEDPALEDPTFFDDAPAAQTEVQAERPLDEKTDEKIATPGEISDRLSRSKPIDTPQSFVLSPVPETFEGFRSIDYNAKKEDNENVDVAEKVEEPKGSVVTAVKSVEETPDVTPAFPATPKDPASSAAPETDASSGAPAKGGFAARFGAAFSSFYRRRPDETAAEATPAVATPAVAESAKATNEPENDPTAETPASAMSGSELDRSISVDKIPSAPVAQPLPENSVSEAVREDDAEESGPKKSRKKKKSKKSSRSKDAEDGDAAEPQSLETNPQLITGETLVAEPESTADTGSLAPSSREVVEHVAAGEDTLYKKHVSFAVDEPSTIEVQKDTSVPPVLAEEETIVVTEPTNAFDDATTTPTPTPSTPTRDRSRSPPPTSSPVTPPSKKKEKRKKKKSKATTSDTIEPEETVIPGTVAPEALASEPLATTDDTAPVAEAVKQIDSLPEESIDKVEIAKPTAVEPDVPIPTTQQEAQPSTETVPETSSKDVIEPVPVADTEAAPAPPAQEEEVPEPTTKSGRKKKKNKKGSKAETSSSVDLTDTSVLPAVIAAGAAATATAAAMEFATDKAETPAQPEDLETAPNNGDSKAVDSIEPTPAVPLDGAVLLDDGKAADFLTAVDAPLMPDTPSTANEASANTEPLQPLPNRSNDEAPSESVEPTLAAALSITDETYSDNNAIDNEDAGGDNIISSSPQLKAFTSTDVEKQEDIQQQGQLPSLEATGEVPVTASSDDAETATAIDATSADNTIGHREDGAGSHGPAAQVSEEGQLAPQETPGLTSDRNLEEPTRDAVTNLDGTIQTTPPATEDITMVKEERNGDTEKDIALTEPSPSAKDKKLSKKQRKLAAAAAAAATAAAAAASATTTDVTTTTDPATDAPTTDVATEVTADARAPEISTTDEPAPIEEAKPPTEPEQTENRQIGDGSPAADADVTAVSAEPVVPTEHEDLVENAEPSSLAAPLKKSKKGSKKRSKNKTADSLAEEEPALTPELGPVQPEEKQEKSTPEAHTEEKQEEKSVLETTPEAVPEVPTETTPDTINQPAEANEAQEPIELAQPSANLSSESDPAVLTEVAEPISAEPAVGEPSLTGPIETTEAADTDKDLPNIVDLDKPKDDGAADPVVVPEEAPLTTKKTKKKKKGKKGSAAETPGTDEPVTIAQDVSSGALPTSATQQDGELQESIVASPEDQQNVLAEDHNATTTIATTEPIEKVQDTREVLPSSSDAVPVIEEQSELPTIDPSSVHAEPQAESKIDVPTHEEPLAAPATADFTTETATEPSTEAPAEPSAETAAEPSAEAAAEPSTETAAEPSTVTVTESPAEAAAEPSVVTDTEPSAEAPAEPSAVTAAEPSTETVIESPAEPSAVTAAESSTETVTEPPTEPSAEAAADPSTETATDSPAEAPAEPSAVTAAEPSTETATETFAEAAVEPTVEPAAISLKKSKKRKGKKSSGLELGEDSITSPEDNAIQTPAKCEDTAQPANEQSVDVETPAELATEPITESIVPAPTAVEEANTSPALIDSSPPAISLKKAKGRKGRKSISLEPEVEESLPTPNTLEDSVQDEKAILLEAETIKEAESALGRAPESEVAAVPKPVSEPEAQTGVDAVPELPKEIQQEEPAPVQEEVDPAPVPSLKKSKKAKKAKKTAAALSSDDLDAWFSSAPVEQPPVAAPDVKPALETATEVKPALETATEVKPALETATEEAPLSTLAKDVSAEPTPGPSDEVLEALPAATNDIKAPEVTDAPVREVTDNDGVPAPDEAPKALTSEKLIVFESTEAPQTELEQLQAPTEEHEEPEVKSSSKKKKKKKKGQKATVQDEAEPAQPSNTTSELDSSAKDITVSPAEDSATDLLPSDTVLDDQAKVLSEANTELLDAAKQHMSDATEPLAGLSSAEAAQVIEEKESAPTKAMTAADIIDAAEPVGLQMKEEDENEKEAEAEESTRKLSKKERKAAKKKAEVAVAVKSAASNEEESPSLSSLAPEAAPSDESTPVASLEAPTSIPTEQATGDVVDTAAVSRKKSKKEKRAAKKKEEATLVDAEVVPEPATPLEAVQERELVSEPPSSDLEIAAPSEPSHDLTPVTEVVTEGEVVGSPPAEAPEIKGEIVNEAKEEATPMPPAETTPEKPDDQATIDPAQEKAVPEATVDSPEVATESTLQPPKLSKKEKRRLKALAQAQASSETEQTAEPKSGLDQSETGANPIIDLPAQPELKAPAETAVESTVEPTAESVVEPEVEPAAEPVAEPVADIPVPDAPVESAVESAGDAPADSPDEHMVEIPAEPAVEVAPVLEAASASKADNSQPVEVSETAAGLAAEKLPFEPTQDATAEGFESQALVETPVTEQPGQGPGSAPQKLSKKERRKLKATQALEDTADNSPAPFEPLALEPTVSGPVVSEPATAEDVATVPAVAESAATERAIDEQLSAQTSTGEPPQSETNIASDADAVADHVLPKQAEEEPPTLEQSASQPTSDIPSEEPPALSTSDVTAEPTLEPESSSKKSSKKDKKKKKKKGQDQTVDEPEEAAGPSEPVDGSATEAIGETINPIAEPVLEATAETAIGTDLHVPAVSTSQDAVEPSAGPETQAMEAQAPEPGAESTREMTIEAASEVFETPTLVEAAETSDLSNPLPTTDAPADQSFDAIPAPRKLSKKERRKLKEQGLGGSADSGDTTKAATATEAAAEAISHQEDEPSTEPKIELSSVSEHTTGEPVKPSSDVIKDADVDTTNAVDLTDAPPAEGLSSEQTPVEQIVQDPAETVPEHVDAEQLAESQSGTQPLFVEPDIHVEKPLMTPDEDPAAAPQKLSKKELKRLKKAQALLDLQAAASSPQPATEAENPVQNLSLELSPEPATEPVDEPTPKTAAEDLPQPAALTDPDELRTSDTLQPELVADELTTVPATGPIAEPTVELVAEPAVEPAAKPVVEPADGAAEEPAAPVEDTLESTSGSVKLSKKDKKKKKKSKAVDDMPSLPVDETSGLVPGTEGEPIPEIEATPTLGADAPQLSADTPVDTAVDITGTGELSGVDAGEETQLERSAEPTLGAAPVPIVDHVVEQTADASAEQASVPAETPVQPIVEPEATATTPKLSKKERKKKKAGIRLTATDAPSDAPTPTQPTETPAEIPATETSEGTTSRKLSKKEKRKKKLDGLSGPEETPTISTPTEIAEPQESLTIPFDAPAEAPAEAPVMSPVETLADPSAEAHLENPAEKNVAVETPAEAPIEVHAEYPADATIVLPAETVAETFAEAPVETSAERSIAVETPVEVSVEDPVETPAISSAKIPSEIPVQSPVDAPMESPVEILDEVGDRNIQPEIQVPEETVATTQDATVDAAPEPAETTLEDTAALDSTTKKKSKKEKKEKRKKKAKETVTDAEEAPEPAESSLKTISESVVDASIESTGPTNETTAATAHSSEILPEPATEPVTEPASEPTTKPTTAHFAETGSVPDTLPGSVPDILPEGSPDASAGAETEATQIGLTVPAEPTIAETPADEDHSGLDATANKLSKKEKRKKKALVDSDVVSISEVNLAHEDPAPVLIPDSVKHLAGQVPEAAESTDKSMLETAIVESGPEPTVDAIASETPISDVVLERDAAEDQLPTPSTAEVVVEEARVDEPGENLIEPEEAPEKKPKKSKKDKKTKKKNKQASTEPQEQTSVEAPELSTEINTEPVTEPATGPATERPTKQVADLPVESATEPSTEATSEAAALPTDELPARASPEPVQEPTTSLVSENEVVAEFVTTTTPEPTENTTPSDNSALANKGVEVAVAEVVDPQTPEDNKLTEEVDQLKPEAVETNPHPIETDDSVPPLELVEEEPVPTKKKSKKDKKSAKKKAKQILEEQEGDAPVPEKAADAEEDPAGTADMSEPLPEAGRAALPAIAEVAIPANDSTIGLTEGGSLSTVTPQPNQFAEDVDAVSTALDNVQPKAESEVRRVDEDETDRPAETSEKQEDQIESVPPNDAAAVHTVMPTPGPVIADAPIEAPIEASPEIPSEAAVELLVDASTETPLDIPVDAPMPILAQEQTISPDGGHTEVVEELQALEEPAAARELDVVKETGDAEKLVEPTEAAEEEAATITPITRKKSMKEKKAKKLAPALEEEETYLARKNDDSGENPSAEPDSLAHVEHSQDVEVPAQAKLTRDMVLTDEASASAQSLVSGALEEEPATPEPPIQEPVQEGDSDCGVTVEKKKTKRTKEEKQERKEKKERKAAKKAAKALLAGRAQTDDDSQLPESSERADAAPVDQPTSEPTADTAEAMTASEEPSTAKPVNKSVDDVSMPEAGDAPETVESEQQSAPEPQSSDTALDLIPIPQDVMHEAVDPAPAQAAGKKEKKSKKDKKKKAKKLDPADATQEAEQPQPELSAAPVVPSTARDMEVLQPSPVDLDGSIDLTPREKQTALLPSAEPSTVVVPATTEEQQFHETRDPNILLNALDSSSLMDLDRPTSPGLTASSTVAGTLVTAATSVTGEATSPNKKEPVDDIGDRDITKEDVGAVSPSHQVRPRTPAPVPVPETPVTPTRQTPPLWHEDKAEPAATSTSLITQPPAQPDKLSVNPILEDIFGSTPSTNVPEQMTDLSVPAPGWGLIRRTDSDFYESEGRVPKLLPIQSFSPVAETTPGWPSLAEFATPRQERTVEVLTLEQEGADIRDVDNNLAYGDITETSEVARKEKPKKKKLKGKEVETNMEDEKGLSSRAETVAAGLIAAGVAAVSTDKPDKAEKSSGKKTKEKKEKKKKNTGKDIEREEDIADGPTLLQDAVLERVSDNSKKEREKEKERQFGDLESLDEGAILEKERDTEEESIMTDANASKVSFDENGRLGGTELASRSVGEEDDLESPVLGRRDSDKMKHNPLPKKAASKALAAASGGVASSINIPESLLDDSRGPTPRVEDVLRRPVLESPRAARAWTPEPEKTSKPGRGIEHHEYRTPHGALSPSPAIIPETAHLASISSKPVHHLSHMPSGGDLRRSASSILAPVLEEHYEDDGGTNHGRKYHGRDLDTTPSRSQYRRPAEHTLHATTQHRASTPEPKRDSGYAESSPGGMSHFRGQPTSKSRLSDDGQLRDSGVHLREWADRTDASSQKSPDLSRSSFLGSALGRPSSTAGGERDKRATGYREAGLSAGVGPALRPLSRPGSTEPGAAGRSRSDNTHAAIRDRERRLASSPLLADASMPLIHQARRSMSNTSLTRLRTPDPLNSRRPESPGINRAAYSSTPPLRRIDKRVSGDLRSLSQRSQTDLSVAGASVSPDNHTASSSHDNSADNSKDPSARSIPVANEGRARDKGMADVYDGFGEGRIGSPRSPTRPHSMRRRQSMQVMELENRVEQLMAENRTLAEARMQAEQSTSQRAAGTLADRDGQIDALRRSLDFLQKEVKRLTEVNEGLNSAINSSAMQHNERFRQLEAEHSAVTRELATTRLERQKHNDTTRSHLADKDAQLANKDTQLANKNSELADKDSEIAELKAQLQAAHEQLEAAQEQIRAMQAKILESMPADGADLLQIHDVDYFDRRCQQLCAHVQQWVLRFSKFSDLRACRLTSEVNDEKIVDRLDNAVLDGSDVDDYLRDRVHRRDIFMAMTMYMIWEFVFTRYLFGMDREQRQKIKSLEKILLDVGPVPAVRQWRAVTLTLLMRQPIFREQRDQDTEAVVQAILQTLSAILPPPTHMEGQIETQLRRVVREAVELSVEMRCQRAEYMMLPPLQPEYDGNGELVETVAFNPELMSERSSSSRADDDQTHLAGTPVRIVLFPLVVKKGDDKGQGDDEIVVCPAQVLMAAPLQRRAGSRAGGSTIESSIGKRRMMTPGSDVGGVSLLSTGHHGSGGAASGRPDNRSTISMTDAGSVAEAHYIDGGI
ncbi:involucrin repeat protein [Ophiostoma piceae UAMH 11346]|uniref:Involucrin repeat protein n=1 Tax=Ophiostoma piceae (strain UAMH 11346) TaxID=1262450 RepID=S3BRR0_OPHP1|nr:involucrin repeat protein [Ophiostoma piceae UAMH 11346]